MRRVIRLVVTALALALVVTLAFGGGPATAAPTEPLFTDQIDAYADYDGADTCSPDEKPGTTALEQLVLAAYPGTTGSIGRSCSGSGSSEHHEGRALDWMVSAETQHHLADDLLDWLLADDSYGHQNAMVRRLGVMYIIWDNEVWRAYAPEDGWQPYGGPDPHTDHVHISMSWDGALQETTWSTGADVGTRLDQARFSATWRGRERLDVFRRGSTGDLEQRTWAGSWAGWVGLGGDLRSGPAAVWSSQKSLWVFGQGTDGTLHQRRWQAGSGWEAWKQTDLQISAAPAVAATRKGRLAVVVRTDIGTVAHRSWRHGRGWSAWADLGGALSGPPSVSWRGRHSLDVFARGSSGQLHLKSKVDGSWTIWSNLGGALTSGPASASERAGQVTVVVRGTDGAIYHRSCTTSCSGWADLGGSQVSGPTVSVLNERRVDLFTRHVSGGLSQNIYEPRTGWTGWSLR